MQKKNSENNNSEQNNQKQLADKNLVVFDNTLKEQKKLRDYVFYFMRNPTPFFMIWVSLILMYGVVCSYPNQMGQDEFYRFIFFLRNPIVILINILALCTALIHTCSCFYSIYKTFSTLSTNKLFSILVIIGLWAIMIGVSIGLLTVVLK